MCRLKTKVTKLTHLQVQASTSWRSANNKKWTENIEDLLTHLPNVQKEEELYDDNCLKLDCIKLQFGDDDDEESDNDSETWPHYGASIKESTDAPCVPSGTTKSESKYSILLNCVGRSVF